MSRKFIITGNVGALNSENSGPVTNNVDQRQSLSAEAAQLKTLREAFEREEATPETQTALTAVQKAEDVEKKSDHAGMVRC